MTRKLSALVLLLALLLALPGCGGTKSETAAAPDMQKLYETLCAAEGTPEMVTVPNDKAEFLMGVAPGDCKQEVVALCQNSLRADELWLIEATDAAAAERIEALAQARLTQKEEELCDYAPEEAQVVRKAKLLRSGDCVFLLVSPRAEALAELCG